MEIREDIFWPQFTGKKIHNASGGAANSAAAAATVMNVLGGEQPSQADPNRRDTASHFQVNDLRKGSKKMLKAGCSGGFSNKTIYVMAWTAARLHIQEKSATIYGQVRQVLKSQHQW